MKAKAEEIFRIIKNAETMIALDKLTENTDLRDIGADSLDMMNILLSIQEKFGIEVPDKDVEKLVSIAEICNYLNNN
jgi:acyl carrier protein